MKKNWKLIIGLLFLAGGFGNITSDIGAATFGLIVATILIFWWVDGRKKQQGYKETLAQRQQEEQEYQEALDKRQQEEQAYQEALTTIPP